MKNPEHNNNLDHLFNKAKADKQDLDDFEKDALAGFDMLASEQEAKDLKASLDTRIQKELFTKEEKNNTKVYWLAAAGLALVIGLSTFFVLNNNDSLSKSGKLAITTSEETKQEALPESPKELKEDVTPPPPPTEVATAADEKSPLQEAEKNQPVKKEELKNLEKVVNTQEKKEPTKGISARSILTPVNAGPKDMDDLEKENHDRKKENNKSGEINDIVQNDKAANLDDMSYTNIAKGKESDNFKARVTTKQDQNVNLAKTEVGGKDMADKSAKEKSKSDDKNKDADAKINSSEVATNGASYANERREDTKPKKTSKKTSDNRSTASSTSPVYEESPGSQKSTPAVTGNTSNAPVEVKKDETTVTTCLYSGGETAMNKELKTKLTAENLDQKFDVILYVNENKEVKKVEFTNAYDLTKKQKEEVTKILKSLDKFNFSATPAKKGEYPYKISYRP